MKNSWKKWMHVLMFGLYMSIRILYSFSFQSLEGFNINMLNKSIEFTLSIVFFLLLSWQSYSDLARQVSDSLIPDEFIESRINSHIIGKHVLLSKFNKFSDGSRSLFFKCDSMYSFMEIDSVVSCNFSEWILLSFLFFSHN